MRIIFIFKHAGIKIVFCSRNLPEQGLIRVEMLSDDNYLNLQACRERNHFLVKKFIPTKFDTGQWTY